jgi:hypothetical protein
MEELRASPIRGESRNNSSPSVLFPSSARTIALGLASVDSISYEVNRTLFFPEKSLSDIEKLKGQSYDYAYHQRQHSDHTTSSTTTVALRNNTAALAGVTLNDTHLASRRAEEAGSKPFAFPSFLFTSLFCLFSLNHSKSRNSGLSNLRVLFLTTFFRAGLKPYLRALNPKR